MTAARADGPHFDPAKQVLPADYAFRASLRYPTRPALVYQGKATTYAQLERLASSFASWLASRGIRRGERIAYLGKNNDLFITVLLGCMRSGAVLVPINWRLTATEIAFVLEDSNTKLVIADVELAATVAAASRDWPLPIVSTDTGGTTGLRSALADHASRAQPTPAEEVNAADPCLLCYTSGTTGKPKAVQLSQLAVAAAREMEHQSPAYSDWSDDDAVLAAMPLFHIGGMSWALGALMRGLTCVIAGDAAPRTILELCQRHSITRLFAVPTSIRTLIEEMILQQIKLPALRGLHYGAAPMDAPLLQAAMANFNCRFVQHFGMTETCGCGTLLGPDDHDPANPALLQSLGRPLPGASVAIRHVTTQEPCGPGIHGEIWIQGPMLMSGYAGNPVASGQALENGWYRSGDGGYLDERAYLYLTDRIKDMIISGGENVYPAEVETVLRRHPAVLEAAVFGVPDPQWGERIVASVELRPGNSADAAELMAHARESLAGFKVPRQFELQAVLPRTASGKVQRSLARQRFLHARDGGA